MDDLSIRNNLIDLIIGAIPTTSKCAVLTLDYLQYINLVQIPRIVKAVLKREGLRRALGPEGKMSSIGPFPVHMCLEFNP